MFSFFLISVLVFSYRAYRVYPMANGFNTTSRQQPGLLVAQVSILHLEATHSILRANKKTGVEE